MKEYGKWPVLMLLCIGAVKAIGLISFISVYPQFPNYGDSADYLKLSSLIFNADPNWYATEYYIRAPGYPAFLAVMTYVGLGTIPAFVMANVVLGALSSLIVFDLGWRVGRHTTAWISGLIIALDPTLFYYQSMILTESLFAFLIAISVWILCCQLNGSEQRLGRLALWALVLGVIVACAFTVRHVLLYFPAFLIAFGTTMFFTGQLRWKAAVIMVLLSSAPSLSVAEVWREHNREVLGIDTVREVGKHLMDWRAPWILARASGGNPQEIRNKLNLEMPQSVRGDPRARNEYKRDIFLDIISEHPGAFIADTFLGSIKVIFDPSQGPLQRFFPEGFGDVASSVDFIGFNKDVWENWAHYGPRIPMYMVLLFYSTCIVTITTAGAGIAIIYFPKTNARQRTTIFTLLLLTAYFVALSSSTSLDSRFRTPFMSALAVLAGLGLSWFTVDIANRYRQSDFRKYFFIGRHILTSRKRVAYQVLALKLFRFVMFPLDYLLSLSTWHSRSPTTVSNTPVVIVLGNHRSGTTVVAQLLQRHFKVAALGNLSSIFPNAPIVYRFVRPLLNRMNNSAPVRNFYGFSAGLFGVGDCYEVWDTWFGSDHSHPRVSDPDDTAISIANYFYVLHRASGLPILAKNNRASLSADFLAGALPRAVFVYVKRDPASVVRSTLTANKDFYGDKRWIWGLRPNPAFPRRAPDVTGNEQSDSLDCAIQQQVELEIAIEQTRKRIPADRVLEITYENLIGPQGEQAIMNLANDIILCLKPDMQLSHIPLAKWKTHSDKVDHALEDDIAKRLEQVRVRMTP